jgi:major inositol transporter-like SP family MFS transporter
MPTHTRLLAKLTVIATLGGLLFVLVNVASFLFVVRCVPETKGTTLEELEERFEAQHGTTNPVTTERTIPR